MHSLVLLTLLLIKPSQSWMTKLLSLILLWMLRLTPSIISTTIALTITTPRWILGTQRGQETQTPPSKPWTTRLSTLLKACLPASLLRPQCTTWSNSLRRSKHPRSPRLSATESVKTCPWVRRKRTAWRSAEDPSMSTALLARTPNLFSLKWLNL